MEPLDLGGCQGYMALKYHMEDAYAENNMNTEECSSFPPYAIFSRKYYEEMSAIDHTKKHDFCFIGAIHKNNYSLRKWIIWFANRYFTSNSIFINTSNHDEWDNLGDYDLTGRVSLFSPTNLVNSESREAQFRVIKDNMFQLNIRCHSANLVNSESREAQFRIIKDNMFYFKTMCQSRFVLCPAGDEPWSFRFYEVLMCKSIPIVSRWHETYRTKEESTIDYQYVLSDNITSDIDYTDMVEKNTKIFEKYHLLPPS